MTRTDENEREEFVEDDYNTKEQDDFFKISSLN